jgi:hypothetical protein
MPVSVMLQTMPMWELRAWRALAFIEGQIAELVKGGTDHDTATAMAWQLQQDEDDDDEP